MMPSGTPTTIGGGARQSEVERLLETIGMNSNLYTD